MLLSYLKSLPSNLSNSKVWCKNQNTSPYSGQTLSRLFMDGREQKSRLIFKICHVYSKIIRLGTVIPYLKKIQKIYELCGIPLEFWRVYIFHQKSVTFDIICPFLGWSLKAMLSHMKSALSNFSDCNLFVKG